MRNSTLLKAAIKKGLKILHFDIETSPHLVYTYPLFKTNIGHNQIIEPMKITSVAYMSEQLRKCYSLEWDFKDGKGSDRDLLQVLQPILNEADLVIGQNADCYDIKIVQWRLNEEGLPPLKNLITLDTLKLSRKVFKPPSHKLDYRSHAYGFGGKIKQDMDDCIAVAQGDEKKQDLRVKYNKKDVIDERKIFWRELDSYQLPKTILKMLNEYIRDERPFCIKCASKRQKRFEVTKRKIDGKMKYQCDNCEYSWKVKR